MTEVNNTGPQRQNIAFELALLMLLATLWGASYTFIKFGDYSADHPDRSAHLDRRAAARRHHARTRA